MTNDNICPMCNRESSAMVEVFDNKNNYTGCMCPYCLAFGILMLKDDFDSLRKITVIKS